MRFNFVSAGVARRVRSDARAGLPEPELTVWPQTVTLRERPQCHGGLAQCGANLHNSGRGRSAAYEFLVFIMMIISSYPGGPCVSSNAAHGWTAPPGSVYETMSVINSWRGDPQATAPIGRKASTNVMPVLESDSESDSWLFSLEYSLSFS